MRGYKDYMNTISVDTILHEKIMNRITQKPRPFYKNKTHLRYAAVAACAVALLFGMWMLPGLFRMPGDIEPIPGSDPSWTYAGLPTPPQNGEGNGHEIAAPFQDPEIPLILYALIFNEEQEELSARLLPPDFMHELTDEQFKAIFPTLDPSRFVANATYWITFMEMTEVSAFDPNGQAFIRLVENRVPQCYLIPDEETYISYVHGAKVTATIHRRYDFINNELVPVYAVRANFILENIAYIITYLDANQETAKERLTELVNQIIAGGAADLSAVADPVVPELRNEALTFEQARLDADFGAYMPTNIPPGFSFDSARRTLNQWDNSLRMNWHSYPTFDNIFWTVAEPHEHELERIVSINDRHKFDVSLYTIPWFDSVPDEIREYFNNPVFLAAEMTLEVVRARARWADRDRGDTPGWRIDNFAVLHESGVVVRVSARGVSPEQLWLMFSLTL
ncbi:MAG: hypothetical protein FWB91_01540 [Defluviitaleaceae bacterium]|nr:hypothetical protein [Defluviitaleaceae bacterium]